jgi:hypothetical protein
MAGEELGVRLRLKASECKRMVNPGVEVRVAPMPVSPPGMKSQCQQYFLVPPLLARPDLLSLSSNPGRPLSFHCFSQANLLISFRELLLQER